MDLIPSARVQQRMKSVFLLYLFVARTLGDCPKPELKENIVFTLETLLMNEFLDDSEITLTCANGYFQHSGSATMKCTDGAWSEPDLICKKKDCGPPPPQPHMSFTTSQGTLFGALAVVICEKGYSIKGVAYKHCYNAGWSGKSTKCEILECDKPKDILNGNNSWISDGYPRYGEHIVYKCHEGFSLTGKDHIICSEEGEYDTAPPQCLGVTKEDAFTTNNVRPTPTPTSTTTHSTKESSTSSGARDSPHTASATPTAPLSAPGGSIVTDAENTTLSSTIPRHSQENQKNDIVETTKDAGYTPVIVSVVCVTLVACIAVLFIHKMLNKRKGSNGTAPIC
ncbi:unnamed protein product [Knipowitschia caucasica]